MSIRLVWPRYRKVCTRRVRDGPRQEDRNIRRPFHLAEKVRPRYVTIQARGQVTKSAQIVFEVICEMVALPRGFVIEFNVDDMVGVLVSSLDHANHVEGCG